MYMRLAFSVAAHLDPEVLIVDEVLAVGDFNFQRKCLNKMRDVGRSGRTVLFVSHDMQAMTRLCSRVIWLKNGQIVQDGEAKLIVGQYLHEQSKTGAEKRWDPHDAPGDETARLLSVRICDDTSATISNVDIRKPVTIEMGYEVLSGGKILIPSMHFYNSNGVCIFISYDWEGGWRTRPREPGIYTSVVHVPGNFLSEGSVFVGASLTTFDPLATHFFARDAVTFNVYDSMDGNSARGDHVGEIPGIVRPMLEWETEKA